VFTGTGAAGKAGVERVKGLLELVRGAMRTDVFGVGGGAGVFSVYGFHRPLLESGLVLLRVLGRVRALAGEDRILAESVHEVCRDWMSMVCESVGNVLSGANDWSDPAQQRDITMVLALLTELVRPEVGLNPVLWASEFERQRTIPILMEMFQKGVSGSMEEKPVFAEEVLLLLLVLSQNPVVAEGMWMYGVVVGFCNNTLTPVFVDGGVPAYINSTRNPWHVVWCLMVSIVSNLTRHLGTRPVFVKEVIGFVQLYNVQIGRSINIILGTLEADPRLTLGELDETNRIADLAYLLIGVHEHFAGDAVVKEQRIEVEGLDWGFLDAFQWFGMHIVRRFVHLFNSRTELEGRIVVYGKERAKFEDGTGDGGDGGFALTDGSQGVPPVILREVRRRMLLVLRSFMTFLRVALGCEAILRNSDKHKWDFSKLGAFTPSVRSQEVDPSLGILLDLLRHMAGIIKELSEEAAARHAKDKGKGKGPAVPASSATDKFGPPTMSAANAVLVAECGLVLVATQLGLHRVEGENWEAVENEVVGDFVASVGELEVLLAGAKEKDEKAVKLAGWQGAEIQDTINLVKVVQGFIRRERIGSGSSGGVRR
ncbi:hypothetical protein HK097_005500, partial [Rhizophlyctis rosea]